MLMSGFPGVLGQTMVIGQHQICMHQEKGLVYFPDQELGAGANGAVYYGAVNFGTPNQKDCAVKVIKMPENDLVLLNTLEEELRIMSKIQHPNIVRYYECVKSNYQFYIFMELCDSKSLAGIMLDQFYQPIRQTQDFSLKTLVPIAEALYYMTQVIVYNRKHQRQMKGLVHRDLKPENIMFVNGIPKLIDFGYSRLMDNTDEFTICTGSPIYMSPNNLNGEAYDPEKNDVWSFGVIIFLMVEGTYPWRRDVETEDELKLAQQSIIFRFDYAEPSLQDLLKKMLAYDENERFLWSDVLKHPAVQPYSTSSIDINEYLLNIITVQYLYDQFQDCEYRDIINLLTLGGLSKHVKQIFKNTQQETYYQYLLEKQLLIPMKLIRKSEFQLKMKLRKRILKAIRKRELGQGPELNFSMLALITYWITGKYYDPQQIYTASDIKQFLL